MWLIEKGIILMNCILGYFILSGYWHFQWWWWWNTDDYDCSGCVFLVSLLSMMGSPHRTWSHVKILTFLISLLLIQYYINSEDNPAVLIQSAKRLQINCNIWIGIVQFFSLEGQLFVQKTEIKISNSLSKIYIEVPISSFAGCAMVFRYNLINLRDVQGKHHSSPNLSNLFNFKAIQINSILYVSWTEDSIFLVDHIFYFFLFFINSYSDFLSLQSQINNCFIRNML